MSDFHHERIADREADGLDLRAAAQAVVERWDTPLWKDVPHTAVYINALRKALAEQPKDEPVAITRSGVPPFREPPAEVLNAANLVSKWTSANNWRNWRIVDCHSYDYVQRLRDLTDDEIKEIANQSDLVEELADWATEYGADTDRAIAQAEKDLIQFARAIIEAARGK